MIIPELLSQTAHRPWPLPESPWLMTQSWEKLLFAHWPVSPEVMQSFLPSGLMADTYDGNAWLGIVPFEMSYRLRGIPWTIRFYELNVRTYVTHQDKPGVFFFSLDASTRLTVQAARMTYALPYFFAQMQVSKKQTTIHYRCQRIHSGARNAVFDAQYEPTSHPFQSQPGSLEHWLTERYCLYSIDKQSRLCRAEVHHLPWPLQQAEAQILKNTMSEIDLPDSQPLLHYSPGVDVVVWPLKPV